MANVTSNPMPFAAQIENVRAAVSKIGGTQAGEDVRTILEGLVQGQMQTNASALSTSAGGQAPQGAPASPSIKVSGANGVYTAQLGADNPAGRTVWHQVSYSATKSFTTPVTTLPPTAASQVTLNLPGQNLFFRTQASFDQTNWSTPVLHGPTAVSSGLVTSAVQDEAVAFNQTNNAVVSSGTAAGAAVVNIAGASGPTSAVTRQKGSTQQTLPGAVVANVPFGSTQFVGYNPDPAYALKATLADVLKDNLVPVGKVSVVNTGGPALPAVTLVLGAGGEVIAWNVTNGGNGLTGPVNLAIHTATGNGATPGAQTIQNGVLIAIAPGNPGQLYSGADTVNVTGGVGQGASGGGQADMGNGGRMTAV